MYTNTNDNTVLDRFNYNSQNDLTPSEQTQKNYTDWAVGVTVSIMTLWCNMQDRWQTVDQQHILLEFDP